VLAEHGEAFVQILAKAADLRGIVRENRLFPAELYDLQQRDQTRGRCQHDVLPQRVIDQCRVFLQRRRHPS